MLASHQHRLRTDREQVPQMLVIRVRTGRTNPTGFDLGVIGDVANEPFELFSGDSQVCKTLRGAEHATVLVKEREAYQQLARDQLGHDASRIPLCAAKAAEQHIRVQDHSPTFMLQWESVACETSGGPRAQVAVRSS